MAQEGILIQFRERFDGHAFGDFVELAELAVRYERKLQAESALRHQNFYAQNDQPFLLETSPEVDVAEIVQGAPYKCSPLEKKEFSAPKDLKSRQKRTYTFDAKKSSAIFDWLLSNKKITLVGRHKLKSADEVTGKKYYKWHDAVTHDTSKCIIFINKIQDEIDKKNIMFLDDESANVANVIEVDEPFHLSCSMVTINTDFTVVLQASQATEIGNQLFNRLLDEGVLIMLKIAKKEGLEDICRRHMNGSHTTDQCQVIRGFLRVIVS